MIRGRILKLHPWRLQGAAVFGVGALLVAAGLGSQSARLFAFGIAPVIALGTALLSAAALDRSDAPRWPWLARGWIVFCVCTSLASLLITPVSATGEVVHTLARVFSYGVALFALLGIALGMRRVVHSFLIRVLFVFAASSSLMLAHEQGPASPQESGNFLLVAARPWLGFWPGVVEAGYPELIVEVPDVSPAVE